MIDFDEVMQRMRSILSTQIKKKKILDKDIAIALQIDPQNYAVIKRRKRVPLEAIVYFSKTHKLNVNWILFSQKPKYLTSLYLDK